MYFLIKNVHYNISIKHLKIEKINSVFGFNLNEIHWAWPLTLVQVRLYLLNPLHFEINGILTSFAIIVDLQQLLRISHRLSSHLKRPITALFLIIFHINLPINFLQIIRINGLALIVSHFIWVGVTLIAILAIGTFQMLTTVLLFWAGIITREQVREEENNDALHTNNDIVMVSDKFLETEKFFCTVLIEVLHDHWIPKPDWQLEQDWHLHQKQQCQKGFW